MTPKFNFTQQLGPNEYRDKKGGGRFIIHPDHLKNKTPQEVIEHFWEQQVDQSYQKKVKQNVRNKTKKAPEELLAQSKTEIADRRQQEGQYGALTLPKA